MTKEPPQRAVRERQEPDKKAYWIAVVGLVAVVDAAAAAGTASEIEVGVEVGR